MEFIEVIQADQLPAGTMKSFVFHGRHMLLDNYEGHFYAMGGTCTHAGGDLSKGKLKGNVVKCPRHGAKFDVTTGVCVAGPRVNIFRSKADNATTYEVKVECNSVKVGIGLPHPQ
mgnify:CR=1 FL=1